MPRFMGSPGLSLFASIGEIFKVQGTSGAVFCQGDFLLRQDAGICIQSDHFRVQPGSCYRYDDFDRVCLCLSKPLWPDYQDKVEIKRGILTCGDTDTHLLHRAAKNRSYLTLVLVDTGEHFLDRMLERLDNRVRDCRPVIPPGQPSDEAV